MNETNSTKVRVRFAPSPTGHLHIGGLRSALFNYLFARHHKGVFLLRIEDTDLERSKPEYTDSIMGSLAWTDILPDEPVVIQSARIKEHQALLQDLVARDKVYRCYCSPEEVISRIKGHGTDEFFVHYDGSCRQYIGTQLDKSFVYRFKLPDREHVTFHDLIRGTVCYPMKQLDDFILARSDGTPMYNFVVVADDAFMRITHVLRGEEHLANTPKQLLLYEACGFTAPQFGHIPLILGPSGDKLSKRDGATSVLEYRTEGYLPDALVNYLVRLGWAHGDQEVFTRDELVDYFTLDAVGKKGAIFDPEKLKWMNSVYMRQQSPEELLAHIERDVMPGIGAELAPWDSATISLAIGLYLERAHTLKELATQISALARAPEKYDEASLVQWVNEQTLTYLHQIIVLLEATSDWSKELIMEELKSFAKKEAHKLVTLLQPMRIALTGSDSGPGVFDLLMVLGKKESIDRLYALARYRR